METFYDGDLKDIWDSDLDPTDSLKMSTDTDIHDWFMERDVKDPAVILNDKLISDALLNGTLPIKSEHSYSLNSDGDSLPESPRSLHTKIDDMEDECYPAISLKTATSNLRHADTSSTGIDPKCLTISTPMSIGNSPLVVAPLLTSSCNVTSHSLVTTSAHNSKIVLPFSGGGHSHLYDGLNKLISAPLTLNLPSQENTSHVFSTVSGSPATTITITKTDGSQHQHPHQQLHQYLPQQLTSLSKNSCGSSDSSREGSTSPDICSDIEIDESCIKDEPVSRDSSCPPSPNSGTQHQGAAGNRNASLTLGLANMAAFKNSDLVFEHKNGCLQLTPASQSLLKSQQLILGSASNSPNIIIPKFNIKTEPANINNKFVSGTPTKSNGGGAYGLPLTPPSSLQSDDSEGNLTPEHLLAPLSPNTTVSISVAATAAGGPLTVAASTSAVRRSASSGSSSTASSPNSAACRNSSGGSTRQPIHTPLISSQPKGSTGMLILTEEEKRTLLAEGYPIPQKLPLTKAEEKSLKKIRRKIKNKISAQESRRKKKEYMDQLERRVEILVNENSDYRKRVDSLEDTNTSLLSQLQKLQALVQRQNLKRS